MPLDCSQEIETDRLIRLGKVLDLIPVSKSTWWEGVKRGKFPKPIKLGRRITCWRLTDIIALIEGGNNA